MVFADRTDAGRQLALRLGAEVGPDVSAVAAVVGLPRGGVPVAFEIAEALHAPLDVIVVRKLGVPGRPEWAMGAVGEGGVRVVNERVVRNAGIDAARFADVEQRERERVRDRAAGLRGRLARVPMVGRTVIVVDDGIATGSTMRAACEVARAAGAAAVIVGVPVGPPDIEKRLGSVADRVVCVSRPDGFSAVGQAYADFAQVSDDEVVRLLERAAGRGASPDGPRGT